MSRLFELVACCGDLRAEAASEKGAAMALQGQLVETRREMAAQQMKSLDVIPGFPAVPGWPGLADADLAGCPGAPGAPPAAPGGPRSYAAALAGAGASLAPSAFGLDAGDLSAQVQRREHDYLAFLTPTAQTTTPARDMITEVNAVVKACAEFQAAAAWRDGVVQELRRQLDDARREAADLRMRLAVGAAAPPVRSLRGRCGVRRRAWRAFAAGLGSRGRESRALSCDGFRRSCRSTGTCPSRLHRLPDTDW
ncbi:hypothetical protein MTO96_030069 [Rhipicephalus appendiculatus]